MDEFVDLFQSHPDIPEDLIEIYSKPAHLVRRCHQICLSLFYEECTNFGITPPQYAVLMAIGKRPGIDQSTIAGIVALDRSNVGKVIERLVAKRFLERRNGTDDRRTKQLWLTDAGSALLARMKDPVLRVQDRILDGLSPAEKRSFMALMVRLVHLKNDASRAPMRSTAKRFKREPATARV